VALSVAAMFVSLFVIYGFDAVAPRRETKRSAEECSTRFCGRWLLLIADLLPGWHAALIKDYAKSGHCSGGLTLAGLPTIIQERLVILGQVYLLWC